MLVVHKATNQKYGDGRNTETRGVLYFVTQKVMKQLSRHIFIKEISLMVEHLYFRQTVVRFDSYISINGKFCFVYNENVLILQPLVVM